MSMALRPIFVILLNFIVGIAVTKGYVAPEHAPLFVEQAADIFGYTILMVTTGVSLYKMVIKHPHQQQTLSTQTTMQHAMIVDPGPQVVPLGNPLPTPPQGFQESGRGE
jgi:hypothetical protein